MTHSIKNRAVILLLVFASCKNKTATDDRLPFYNKPDFTPEWIETSSPDYKNIHTIPAFSFTDQDGEKVTEQTVKGKIYVADFIFTRCAGICPRMTANMGYLQKKLKEDSNVLLLSHSVTPEADSVPVLKKYARQKGAIAGKWYLLTGNVDSIYRLAKREYFAGDSVGYYGNQNDFLHTENFILIDKKRRIRGVYNGTLLIEMTRLQDDIHTLEKEDADN